MNLHHHETAADFLDRAGEFLAAHEAENNLILGLLGNLTRNPQAYGDEPPYLVTVEEGGEVVGAAVRTPPYNLLLSADLPDAALDLILADAHTTYGTLPGVQGSKANIAAFIAQWQALTGHTARLSMAMRIYRLTEVTPPEGVPGQFRHATEADRDQLIEWFAAFTAEAVPNDPSTDHSRLVDRYLTGDRRGLVMWEDEGRPVSMAGFGGPTPHGIKVNAVYTPPDLRHRGYASACVATLSQFLLDQGYQFCFLFTDLSNPTSNKIYMRMGYQPVSDVDQYMFEDAG